MVELPTSTDTRIPEIPGYSIVDVRNNQLSSGPTSEFYYSPNFEQPVTAAELVTNFAKGVGDAAYGLTVGTGLSVLDLGAAAASVSWNELGVRDAYNLATNSKAPNWYADLHSPTAEAYQHGTSQAELILSNTPLLNVGVMSYHATTSAMNGDWNGLARQGGGLAGGFVVGKGVGKYGNYGVTVENIGGPAYGPLASQRGSAGIKLVGLEGANTILFKNQLPEKLAIEMAEAKAVGVKPIRFGDPAFEATVNQGGIKFVVTESSELLIAPHTVNGVEISHAVLSKGKSVLAAGQADIAGSAGQYVGLRITPHSGHFLNGATQTQSAAAENIGRAAFKNIGIEF